MFSALWDLFGSVVRALFDLGGAVLRVVFQLFSAVASAIFWPFRATWGAGVGQLGVFGPPGPPPTWGMCVVVFLALVGPAALRAVEEGEAVRAGQRGHLPC